MMNKQPDYGNWVPQKLLGLLWGLTLAAAALLLASFTIWDNKTLGTVFAVLTGLLLLYAIYMQTLHHLFSFSGAGLMGKIHSYIADMLPWDGQGTLLDVGCGAGALTIRCAKKFKTGSYVGLDYWGMVWDYAQNQCQENARLEGVPNIKFVKGDACHLDYPDESFDAVVSNFVYHEVRTAPDKQALVRESLRVVKKGGCFALHDLFENKRLYGDMEAFAESLRREGFSEVHYEPHTENLSFIPPLARSPMMLQNLGLLYGRK